MLASAEVTLATRIVMSRLVMSPTVELTWLKIGEVFELRETLVVVAKLKWVAESPRRLEELPIEISMKDEDERQP